MVDHLCIHFSSVSPDPRVLRRAVGSLHSDPHFSGMATPVLVQRTPATIDTSDITETTLISRHHGEILHHYPKSLNLMACYLTT